MNPTQPTPPTPQRRGAKKKKRNKTNGKCKAHIALEKRGIAISIYEIKRICENKVAKTAHPHQASYFKLIKPKGDLWDA